jgi:exonuclease SbcC
VKILAIHLRNLNSLAGSWSIDFTAPEYAASGIFAITGPTGAGKSTLLDAICLALFGRTPRLGAITRGSNEIMSRRAGDCFAEVSFATSSGRYRCHWGQHRAHRKPGGELQAPRHEIVDLESGKVLENRTREVGRLVEQVTGMDYDRFTRSILLAQGDFAAFLDADADQRAPILEQITGTGIYSRLSIAVHERTSEERKKIAALQEGLASVKLLRPEEEQKIAAAIAASTQAAGELRARQERVEDILQRLTRIQALKGQLSETEASLIRLVSQRQEAELDLQRLEQGQRAQILVPLHADLTHLQEQIQTVEHRERQRSQALQHLEQTQQTLFREHALAHRHLEESQATRERELERIKTVRALDLQLHEKSKAIHQGTITLAQQEKDLEKIRLERKRLQRQLIQLQHSREALRRDLDEHAADVLLVEQFAGLRQQLLHLDRKEEESDQLRQSLATARKQHQQATSRQQRLDQAVEQATQALNTHRQEQQRVQREREDLLGEHSLPQLRRELAGLEARLQRLERGSEWVARLQALQEESCRQHEQASQLLNRREQLQEQLQHLEEQHLLRTQLVRHCEENHQLSLRIRSYEQERGQLREGHPCPLCGSTHHPWKTDQPPTDDRAAELAQARAGLEQTLDALAKQREALAVSGRDLEHLTHMQLQSKRQIEALTGQLAPLLAELELGPIATGADAISRGLETGRQLADTLRTRLTAIDQVDGKLQALVDRIEQATSLQAEATQQAQTNLQAVATGESDLRNLDSRFREAEAWLAGSREELRQSLAPFACAEIPAQGCREVIKSLETRLQRWKLGAAQQEELARTEAQLVSGLNRQDLQDANLEVQRKNQDQELTILRQQQAALHKQRQELYGELDPDMEEQRLRSLVQQAEAREMTARTKLVAHEKELHGLGEQQRLDREELAALRPRKSAQEAHLLARIQAVGFADMAAFAGAILPPETLEQLTRTRQHLEQQQALLAARKKELADALVKEETDLDQSRTQPELQQDKEALQQQIDELLQRIGGDRERLLANERLMDEFAQQRRQLADQQRELERWELLHQLIGSADGKKFRVFAQGLTFEVMVSHANRQLRKMSDRYILLRDPGQPLALQVIDNYQAGEIRSTRNLSGGESFLVSLALSLGLSAMASHNVRVDSLFLDEGFGTLDEETLDTALQTLAELQQDGKLIGIISHVPLLRERIDLRIQVQPGADGCSRLVGPGCAQLG